MSEIRAILHHDTNALRNPDWFALRLMAHEPAAVRLTGILRSLDGVEKQVFAMRGMAALLVEERELYRFVVDEEVGDCYQSFDRYLKQEFPASWSYVRDALRAVKELKDMPFEDLLQIKRANLEQLKKVSSSVRILPEVVAAAKTMPEKEFVEEMNKRGQHLEVKQPVVMAPADDCTEFETAVEMVMVVDECHSRAEALKSIGVRIIQEVAAEYEHRKEATA
jgi:hypothetical protein